MLSNLEEVIGGHYRIVRFLGSGGFGQTYLARDHRRHDCYCVIKLLQPQSCHPGVLERARELFEQEAKILHQLGDQHPQIPQMLAYFEENQQFYLVQEYIEGHPLSEEFTCHNSGEVLKVTFNQQQVIKLLRQILEILEFVHNQGIIHRDIKPSNLMRRNSDGKIVLIDFGAVRQIGSLDVNSSGQISSTLAIGCNGYMPVEQMEGCPKLNSDIYAVGMVAIQALTGLHPQNLPIDPQTLEKVWRYSIPDRSMPEVSEELAELLHRMVRRNFQERYQSVAEVLQALTDLSSTPLSPPSSPPSPPEQDKPWLGLAVATLTGIAIGTVATLTGIAIGIVDDQTLRKILGILPPQTCETVENLKMPERFSCGQKILITADMTPEKQAGVQAFATGDWTTAMNKFSRSLSKQRDDPETLIYLNNAKAARTGNTLLIAVSVPIGGNLNIAKEMLRGVAQAQNEVNLSGGINDALLQVVIVNDDNDSKIAKQVAAQLVKDPSILAVVGHNASEVSIAVAKVYQQGKLVMISPTSNAVELPIIGNYIFRTIASNQIGAQSLSDYAIRTAGKTKFAICFDSTSAYSTSIKQEFSKAVETDGGKLKEIKCDFAQPNFNPSSLISKAIADGVNGLALFPSVATLYKAIDVAQVNQRRIDLFGGDSMHNIDTLKLGQADVNNMVLAAVWHPEATPKNPFLEKTRQLWGASVGWRTATSYDAVKAIVAGLEQSSTREELQKTLSDPNFQVQGATGKLQFLASDDHQLSNEVSILLKVQSDSDSSTGTGYKFIPIKPDYQPTF
ncbi:MAG: ABC transporter substrate-binding protein [Symploca sp. SIO2E9]|nr:ABC transporter substrate-binding protein [Symploca sp. SIO2E9]